jgi:alpha-L-fucosidase 2
MNRRQFIANAGMAGLAAHLLRNSGNALEHGHGSEVTEKESKLSLWYDKPATDWNEALPLGNGRIGAMVFGRVDTERIQLNEATLWTGKPHDYTNPDARKNLDAIRKLIFDEDVDGAERLAPSLLGIPPTLHAYQPFCDLHLDFYTDIHSDKYKRSLDLRSAITSVSYRCGDVQFSREAFISNPDQVFVLHLSANQPGQQSFKLSLSTPHDNAEVAAAPNALFLKGEMRGHTPPASTWTAGWEGRGTKFAAQVHLLHQGGTVTASRDALMIEGADEATILVDLATSFVNYRDISGDPDARLQERSAKRSARSYVELRSRHVADYGDLFNRVEVELDGPSASNTSTDRELVGYATTPKPALMALYYQVGRYLLIAASRPGGQPANLQGIWNENLRPAWGSKWTTNINLEMNYWAAETGALAECVEPFYGLLADLRVTGAEVARVHYGCKGFVFHHNADIWRAATPVDGSWGLWPVGGTWLVLQTWEHYAFSRDKEFLRTTAYPALKDAVEFMLSFLVEIPTGKPFAGCLATNPTSSPENAFILPNGVKGRLTYATSMDIEMIGELFEKFVMSARELGVDADLAQAAEKAHKRLPPLQVNREGELQEWIGDYQKTEAEHRHLSHLWALYPGCSISAEKTPALAAGARKSLELRGDGDGNGCWLQAWRAALWARLHEGDHAHRILGNLLTHATLPNMLHDYWDQIDGHLGGPAAIAEMLIQSQSSEIELLPALPDAWANGSVRGLCARGAAVLDFAWKNGLLTSVKVHAKCAGNLKLRYGKLVVQLPVKEGSTTVLDGMLRQQ